MNQDIRQEALAEALRRVAHRDVTALREVYDQTSAKLFGVCLRILGEPSEAEDVLQEVYSTVWRRAETFDSGRASAVTWLAAIARNRSIDRLRARPTMRPAPIEAVLDLADETPSAEMRLQDAQETRRLYGCLDELEEPHRNAVRGAFLDGFTYEALAQRADVPLGTMKSWIRRSLLKLRACLER